MLYDRSCPASDTRPVNPNVRRRGIADLRAGSTSGRRYETLFCDEADGERKRMFMQMKREVLRLGGYAREYFISQTPELT